MLCTLAASGCVLTACSDGFQAAQNTGAHNLSSSSSSSSSCPTGTWNGSVYTTGAIAANCTASISSAVFDPANPAAAGFSLVFSDDFYQDTSLSSLDCGQTKARGFKWYLDSFYYGVGNACQTTFQGSISTNGVLTVSGSIAANLEFGSPAIYQGDTISLGSTSYGTITAQLSGATNGIGTYQLSQAPSSKVTSTTLTANMYTLINGVGLQIGSGASSYPRLDTVARCYTGEYGASSGAGNGAYPCPNTADNNTQSSPGNGFVGTVFGNPVYPNIPTSGTTGYSQYYFEISFQFLNGASYTANGSYVREAMNLSAYSIQQQVASDAIWLGTPYIQWPGQATGVNHHEEYDILEFLFTSGTRTYLTGSISGNVLTVANGWYNGPVYVGEVISLFNAPNTPYGTIVAQLSGTPNGFGTYQLSQNNGSVASNYMTAVLPGTGHWNSGLLNWFGAPGWTSANCTGTNIVYLGTDGQCQFTDNSASAVQLTSAPNLATFNSYGSLYQVGSSTKNGSITTYFNDQVPLSALSVVAAGNNQIATPSPATWAWQGGNPTYEGLSYPPATPWATSDLDGQDMNLNLSGNEPILVKYVHVWAK